MKRPGAPHLVALGVLVLVGLSLWPATVRGELGGDAEAAECLTKLNHLDESRRAGQVAERTFGEQEINARLAALLAQNIAAQEARGLTVGLEDLRAAISSGVLHLYVRTRFVGVPLTFEARFGDGWQGPLTLRSLWVGHLPLVGPLQQFFSSRMRPLFRELRPERDLLRHLDTCTMDAGQLTVSVTPEERGPKF